MAQECGFFNAQLVGEQYDRVYLAEQFAAYFSSFIGNGVFGKSMQQLEVMSQNSPNMSIKVGSGQGWINGWWYRNTDEYTIPVDVADGALSRVDIVVLRWGNSERDMWLQVIKGKASSNPVEPSIRRDADYYDLELARIYIPAGSINITQAQITDTRLDSRVCGLVTGVVNQIDTTDLYNQFESYFSEFKERYEVDMSLWTDEQKRAYSDFVSGSKESYEEFTESQEQIYEEWYDYHTNSWTEEFENWFENVKGNLDEDAAGHLQLQVDELKDHVGVDKMVWLSDLDWSYAQQDFETTNKDKNCTGGEITLCDGEGKVFVCRKGVGTHANGEIHYSLTPGEYDVFESLIGVNAVGTEWCEGIKFRVYTNNGTSESELYRNDKEVFTQTTPAKYIRVPIPADAVKLIIAVQAAGSTGAAWANWGGAKLIKYRDRNPCGIEQQLGDIERSKADSFRLIEAENKIALLQDRSDVLQKQVDEMSVVVSGTKVVATFDNDNVYEVSEDGMMGNILRKVVYGNAKNHARCSAMVDIKPGDKFTIYVVAGPMNLSDVILYFANSFDYVSGMGGNGYYPADGYEVFAKVSQNDGPHTLYSKTQKYSVVVPSNSKYDKMIINIGTQHIDGDDDSVCVVYKSV